MHISEAVQRIKSEMSERGLIERICDKKQDALYDFYIGMAYSIGYKEGTKHTSHPKKVAQYDMEGKFIKIYGSLTIAANKVHRNKSAIMRACKGESEHCAGYKWKYVENGTH